MIQGYGFNREHRIFEHREEQAAGGWCWNGCLLGRPEAVACSERCLSNLTLVKLPNFDRERIAIHEIPGIAAQFAMDIVDQARRPEQSERLATPKRDAKDCVEPDEVIHVRMGDEDFSGPEQSGRPQVVVVPEVKEQGSLRPANFYVDAGVAKDVVDQITGEGRVHERIIQRSGDLMIR